MTVVWSVSLRVAEEISERRAAAQRHFESVDGESGNEGQNDDGRVAVPGGPCERQWETPENNGEDRGYHRRYPAEAKQEE